MPRGSKDRNRRHPSPSLTITSVPATVDFADFLNAERRGQRSCRSLTPSSPEPERAAHLPSKLTGERLLACMICSLIKSQDQFEKDGCDNCECVLQLAGQTGASSAYTSGNFEGMIGLVNTKDSWVAKWQHLETLKKGIYAVSVKGNLPNYLREELRGSGYTYRCRDKGMTAEALAERQRSMDDVDFEERQRRTKIRRRRRTNNKKRTNMSTQSRVSESESTAVVSDSESVAVSEHESTVVSAVDDDNTSEGDSSSSSSDQEQQEESKDQEQISGGEVPRGEDDESELLDIF